MLGKIFGYERVEVRGERMEHTVVGTCCARGREERFIQRFSRKQQLVDLDLVGGRVSVDLKNTLLGYGQISLTLCGFL
jgi:hypothetical protein